MGRLGVPNNNPPEIWLQLWQERAQNIILLGDIIQTLQIIWKGNMNYSCVGALFFLLGSLWQDYCQMILIDYAGANNAGEEWMSWAATNHTWHMLLLPVEPEMPLHGWSLPDAALPSRCAHGSFPTLCSCAAQLLLPWCLPVLSGYSPLQEYFSTTSWPMFF